MKTIITLLFTALSVAAGAQIKTPLTPSVKPVINKTNSALKPAVNGSSTLQATTPVSTIQEKPKSDNSNTAPTQPSAPTLTDADYFLSVAKVTIKTAQDNKEVNSKLYVSVYPAAGTDNYRKGYTLDSYTPELKPWSTNTFTLPKAPGFDKSFNSLAHYKQTGIMVDILYNTLGNGPFFLTDAWKIQEISAVLEFKDSNGNPHPTMPSKTIYFSGGDLYLDFLKWHLYCKTDEYFNVLPTFITKRE